jgi:HPt (histidine-containing phosphotransfer) domain-containing protein
MGGNGEILREDEALERLGGDRDFLLELLGDLVEVAGSEISQLREALESGDEQVAIRSAHSIKGAAANLSAVRLSGRAREVEMTCRDGRMDEAAGMVDGLEEALKELREYAGSMDD